MTAMLTCVRCKRALAAAMVECTYTNDTMTALRSVNGDGFYIIDDIHTYNVSKTLIDIVIQMFKRIGNYR